jgi:hypothetical protein
MKIPWNTIIPLLLSIAGLILEVIAFITSASGNALASDRTIIIVGL